MRVRTGWWLVMLLSVVGAVFASSNLNQFGVADVRQVTFFDQVKIGDTIVPAGEYKVLHAMEADSHVMLFKQIDAPASKATVVKVKCTLKPLDQVAKTNEQRFRTENGVQVLTVLQFKGDKAQHVF
jgi:hypothetical protein